MPGLSKTVSHEYDPRVVFHTYSSNVPHLQSWIDELINLTEQNLPSTSFPTTDSLVESLQRYDAVYKELLRQTGIFSDPLQKMYSQLWKGVMILMTFMIKSYNRYVKHTSHLQAQAQQLLSDRQKGEAASKVQKEEFDLERAALRANIRNVESELDSLKMSNKQLEHENTRLRSIIDVYLRSTELNDPVWDLMKNDEILNKEVGNAIASSEEIQRRNNTKSSLGFRRRDIVDVGRVQLKLLNKLDIEANEVLTNILKEENRQRLLMKDLMKLIGKNQDLFFSHHQDPYEDYSIDDNASDGGLTTINMLGNIEFDESTLAGAVDDQELEAFKSAIQTLQYSLENNPNLRSSLVPAAPKSQLHRNHTRRRSIVNTKKSVTGRRASILPSSTRASMSSFANIFSNANPAVANQMVHHSNPNPGVSIGIQTDEKDEMSAIIDFPEDHKRLDVFALGVAPLAPENLHKPGLDIPYQIRKLMTSFPNIMRVPPVAWVYQIILSIYLDKIEDDYDRMKHKEHKFPMTTFIHHYFMRIYGVPSISDVQIATFLKACEAHSRKQPRISLFSSQIGLINKEEDPTMDIRDTDFVLQVIDHLISQGELQSNPNQNRPITSIPLTPANALVTNNSSPTKRKLNIHTNYIRPDILRTSAINTILYTFDKLLPDNGEDYCIKIRSMQGSELGQKYIDLDLFLDVLIEPWHNIRSNWEDHATFLFKRFCGVFRVLQEATFANDEGLSTSDTILVEVQKQYSGDCYRRPLRLFQQSNDDSSVHGSMESAVSMNDDDSSIASTIKNETIQLIGNGNPNKEPVCELINRQRFTDCLNVIEPRLSLKEIDDIFDEAIDLAHERVLRSLDILWSRFLDEEANYTLASRGSSRPLTENAHSDMAFPKMGRQLGTNREFWVNNRTNLSQWTRPFYPRTFRASDIELSVFVDILIRKNIFPKCPFIELMNIAPNDLWPNADMFYKQILEKQKGFNKK